MIPGQKMPEYDHVVKDTDSPKCGILTEYALFYDPPVNDNLLSAINAFQYPSMFGRLSNVYDNVLTVMY